MNLGNMYNVPAFPPARENIAGKNAQLLLYIKLYTEVLIILDLLLTH
jgi:hypothetical protein